MPPVKTAPRWHAKPSLRLPRPALLLAALTLAVAMPFALFVWLLPPPLVLPAFGLLALALAGVLAAADWLVDLGSSADRLTARDIGGALALFGASAAIFADLDHAARWLGL